MILRRGQDSDPRRGAGVSAAVEFAERAVGEGSVHLGALKVLSGPRQVADASGGPTIPLHLEGFVQVGTEFAAKTPMTNLLSGLRSRRIICVMARSHNPNWGKPLEPPRAGPTEFEMEVRRLRLTPVQYVHSEELRRWCERHRNHFYVPEWLLKAWRIEVEDTLSGAA